ncbi:MAG: TolC family protein [Planctomycetota bacterium]
MTRRLHSHLTKKHKISPGPCRAAGVGAFVFASTALLLTGCASERPYADLWVPPRPYHADADAARPPASALDHSHHASNPAGPTQADANPTGELTLRDAVALSLRHSPALAASGWASTAAEAEARQMGQAPNPRVGFSSQNFAGPERGDTLERHTLRISQVIELADKRARRLALGEATQRLRAWDFEQQRVDIAAEAGAHYVAVVTAQQRVTLAEQQLALAQDGLDVANDRAQSGTAPGLECDQATARVALRRIALEQARQQLAAERADLAATWGAADAVFDRATGDLDTRVQMPALDALRGRLAQSPAVARWDDEIAQRQAKLHLARANATPDPTVGIGLRYFPEADETAGVAEISIPLNIFDDNRDAILAARLRVSQAEAQRRHAYTEANRLLTNAYARLESADFALTALDQDALPAAQRAYDAALESYAAGLTDYLMVLDAERTVLEIRNRQLDTALTYHRAVLEIERITSSSLGEDSDRAKP